MATCPIQQESADNLTDVRKAAVHPNPYPYYARLAVGKPFYREEATNAWIASNAATVKAVLTSPLCLTRPAGRVVPELMAGTATADIFGNLVRMAEGEAHCPLKSSINAAIECLDMGRIGELTYRRARELALEIEPELSRAHLTKFIYALPVEVIARSIGVPPDRVSQVAQWANAYGTATAAAVTGVPAPSAAVMEAGNKASQHLLDYFAVLSKSPSDDDGVLAQMTRAAALSQRPNAASIVVNAIGLMAQGFAATASLIGATLLALGQHRELRARTQAGDRPVLDQVIQEVLRCDPVTQSLPRFVGRDGMIGEQSVRRGEMIIAVLAAANRDPLLNADPNRFDIARSDRKYLEFGAGIHACAAGSMATMIAKAGVEVLLARGLRFDELVSQVSYRPSLYVRMPIFH
jgi:cytochrome P450